MTKKIWIGAIVVAGIIGIGVGAVGGAAVIGEYRSYRQLQATTVDIVRLLNYNLQSGAIKGLPAQPGPAAAPPSSTSPGK